MQYVHALQFVHCFELLAAVGLLAGTEGTVWLALISLVCFKWTIHGCFESQFMSRHIPSHCVSYICLLNSNNMARKIEASMTTDNRLQSMMT